ncbi:MAG: hypothetical protein JXA66_04715 [Oligoflexia bacterium]|nr:hypothetical protein [Oligoflexia bacterium]
MESNIRKLAVFLFMLGILFAVETYYNYLILNKLWPVILTSLGGGFIAIFFKRKKREPFYLASGVYIICFSILALVCNFTNWDLTRVWPVFIGFIGISQLALYVFHTRHRLYLFMMFVFFSISVVFYLVFTVSYKFWWTMLFMLGFAMLISVRKDEKKNIID